VGEAEDDRPLKVVYITGAQRGGTTILARVLGSLEGFVFGGELRRAWSLMGRGTSCGCGLPYSQCGIWSSILADDGSFRGWQPGQLADLQRRVAPSGHSWWRTWRLLLGKTIAQEERLYLKVMTDLYHELASRTDADVLIDSSKVPIDPALLLRARVMKSFCIHVIRDPRASVFSTQRRAPSYRRPQGVGSRDAQIWRTVKTSAGWCSRHLASEAVRRRYGVERSLLVRYEDFVREPKQVLARICELVDRPSDVESMRPESLVMPAEHNPSRTSRVAAREVTIRRDDRWERELNRTAEQVTWALTFAVARRYGYRRRPLRHWATPT
jgi:hypothetical protein